MKLVHRINHPNHTYVRTYIRTYVGRRTLNWPNTLLTHHVVRGTALDRSLTARPLYRHTSLDAVDVILQRLHVNEAAYEDP